LKIGCIGSTRSIASVRRFEIALPRKKALMSKHVPGMRILIAFSIGWHCRMLVIILRIILEILSERAIHKEDSPMQLTMPPQRRLR
jgi:hypothetical protein